MKGFAFLFSYEAHRNSQVGAAMGGEEGIKDNQQNFSLQRLVD